MLRTSGVAYSMLSLAAGQACYELMMKWRSIANGEDGLAITLPREVFGLPLSIFQRPDSMFMISWAVLIIVVVCRSEEHTSELQSLMRISYAVFCLKKKKHKKEKTKKEYK